MNNTEMENARRETDSQTHRDSDREKFKSTQQILAYRYKIDVNVQFSDIYIQH